MSDILYLEDLLTRLEKNTAAAIADPQAFLYDQELQKSLVADRKEVNILSGELHRLLDRRHWRRINRIYASLDRIARIATDAAGKVIFKGLGKEPSAQDLEELNRKVMNKPPDGRLN